MNYRDNGTPNEKAAYWYGFLDGGSRMFMEVKEGVEGSPWISEDDQAEILTLIDWFYETYGKYLHDPELFRNGAAK